MPHLTAFQVQSSDQSHMPDAWWGQKTKDSSAFIDRDLAARLAAAKQSADDWLTDVKFGEAHISDIGEVIVTPDKYKLVLDMIHFKPEDISIRAVHNGFYVRAAHPEIVDGKEYITEHFYREYVLPHDIDPLGAKSWITPENILFVEAPKVEFDPNTHSEESTVKEVKVVRQAQ